MSEREEMINRRIRTTQTEAEEALSIASAEPHDAMRAEASLEAYEAYEEMCRKYGVCRTDSCLRRTTRGRCTDHRKHKSQP